ncbi:unnamed protein product [Echinostoma caproni]|uniref:CA domain-containing protein n=1 Tax=Echinostoma caproni TaxID=27848 RepID=A0A183A5I8_9TREM|nr:unnamed protein product [Echinostoma caproni]
MSSTSLAQMFCMQILEGNRPNVSLGKLRAHDPDDGPNGQVTYRIVWPSKQPLSDRPFLMTDEGKLIATKTLDREANPKGYQFRVIAFDGGKPVALNSTAEVEVLLEDVNDCTPQFLQRQYNFSIEEDYAQNFTTGRWVGQVKAVDCDLGLNGAISYMILDPGLPFEITRNGILKTTRFIDREMRAVYRLTVLARDGGDRADEGERSLHSDIQGYETIESSDMFNRAVNDQKVRTSAAQVQITVTDVNDHYPIFVYPNASSYQVRVSMHEKKGFIITRLVAVDKDTGSNGQIRYGIIKGNSLGLFKVRPDTGELFLDRTLTSEHKGNMFLIVEASDLGQPRAQTNSLEIRLTITDEPAIGRKINMLDATAAGGKLGPFEMMAMDNTIDGDSSGAIELNKLIMMCIVISTAVVCVIMIFAIGIFVRRTSCHALLASRRRRPGSTGCTVNGATANAERYTNPWETDSNGKPDGFEMSGDSRLGTSKLTTFCI